MGHPAGWLTIDRGLRGCLSIKGDGSGTMAVPSPSAMSTIMLCLLCAVAMVVQPASAAPVGNLKQAENEELTLLFHGTLQLGQALNSAYRSTEARLMEARHSVDLYGRALGLLGQEVSQGWDAAQELRTSLLEIQVGTAVGALWGM